MTTNTETYPKYPMDQEELKSLLSGKTHLLTA